MSEVRAINSSICKIESEEKSLIKVRASSAEKAAHLLDTALSARSANSQGRDSHFVFTLHLFQHRLVHFFISASFITLWKIATKFLFRKVLIDVFGEKNHCGLVTRFNSMNVGVIGMQGWIRIE